MSRFSLTLCISFALHIAMLSAYWFFSSWEPPIKLDTPKIQVSLAKLGKPRDQSLLPRIDASEPPVSQPLPAPKTPSKSKQAPAHKNPSNPLDVLKKRFGKATHDGHEHGSKLGSSLTSELADSYELQVLEILRENYEIPRTISDREAKHLSLWIRIWISRDGHPIKIRTEQASRNPRFDQAVLTGSHRIRSFGAPPLQLARKYQTEGLLIQFCPLEC